MIVSDRKTAMRSKATHSFVPGRGYVRMKPLALPVAARLPRGACEPPLGTINLTWHLLKPPGRDEPMRMQWQAEGEWAPVLGAGKRVAFPAVYLAAHGWSYVGAA